MTTKATADIQETIRESVLEAVDGAVESAIKKYVNGKIDRLDAKIEAHHEVHAADMAEIKPFLQAVAGAKVLGSGLKWLAGIAIAYLTIKTFITGSPI